MKMRVSALAAAAVLCAAGAAQAAFVVINQGAYSFGNGGEFNAQLTGVSFSPKALSSSGFFETFCLEVPENFQPGATYSASIATFADGGGAGGQDSSGTDPLSELTAYLYEQFITGNLAGYDYADSLGQRKNDAGSLQQAIWYLEDEIALSAVNAKGLAFLAIAANGAGQGLGDVRVVNVYDNSGGKRQSQLVSIPSPGSLVLAGVGLAVAARRRRA
ncbi:MAG: hypothetical protein SFY95_00365 [Planctomycetota bacterium]|nr:hypothetical protein [Planctomycetota bacterium]